MLLLLLLLIYVLLIIVINNTCVNICDGRWRLDLQEKQPFERIEVTRDQALEMFSDNKFKASITFFSSLRVRWGVDKLLVFMILSIVFWITSSYYLSHVSYFLPPIFFYISQINNLVLWLHGYHDQIEIINDLPADKTITVYRCGPLVDLCRGPHIPNTSFVKAIACLKVRINYFISLPFLVLIYPLTYVNGKYFGFIGYCIWNSRLHQHIGGGTKIGKVYKEFMAYLILIRKV